MTHTTQNLKSIGRRPGMTPLMKFSGSLTKRNNLPRIKTITTQQGIDQAFVMTHHRLKPNLHDRCPCELRLSGPHIGLYCKPHQHWLKWLTPEETKTAIELGTKLATIPNRDKLTLKDNRTVKQRIRRQKRWLKYKSNKGS